MTKRQMMSAAENTVHDAFGFLHYGLVDYRSPRRANVMRQIMRIRRERKMLQKPPEAYQLYAAASAVRKISGDAAEVGVYRGASAKLIRLALPEKFLHLFDTFEGLPEPEAVDGELRAGHFLCGLDEVKHYLGSEPSTRFHVGIFPGSAAPVKDRRFSFVHLDMDLYEGTRDALNWFYPRMQPGGVIITHDYIVLAGPTKAFDEFFGEKPDPIIELSSAQCMAVKISC